MRVAVADGVAVLVLVGKLVLVSAGVAVSDGSAACVSVGVGDGDDVAVDEGFGVWVGAGVAVRVSVLVAVEVAVAVADGVRVGDAVIVLVAVGEVVSVGVGLVVIVAVMDGVSVMTSAEMTTVSGDADGVATTGEATTLAAAGEPAVALTDGDAAGDATAGDASGDAIGVATVEGLDSAIGVPTCGVAGLASTCGEASAMTVSPVSGDAIAGEAATDAIGLATGDDCADAAASTSIVGLAIDVAGVPAGEAGGGNADSGEAEPLAGGETTRGVSVATGDVLRVAVRIPTAEIGELSKAGEAARVAARSADTWVNTLGGIVITSSFGVELDWVRMSASSALASMVATAIRAFVRFNETSRFGSRAGSTLTTPVDAEHRPDRIDSLAGADFTRSSGISADCQRQIA